MTDEEIRELINGALEASSDVHQAMFLVAKEVQCKTAEEYFKAINQANQAADLKARGYNPK